jgi:glucokinase
VILAGDIGGTNARLALFTADLREVDGEVFPTGAHGSLGEIVERFLHARPARIESACFGIAATVANGAAAGVNLPWHVEARELAAAAKLPSVALVNDLEANAAGTLWLGPRDLLPLADGRPAAGNRAIVSAGTGLGEAALWWDGERHHVLASEGGHADFAPRTELEIELLRDLAAKYGHVSYERVCSGRGLVDIHDFLCRFRGVPYGPTTPAGISARADADPASPAAEALDLFASVYGARAGNVALAFMAVGGVYLGGGIAPKLRRKLADGAFMRAFVGKGRFTPLLERIPVHVIVNDRTALLGAAHIAAEHGAVRNGGVPV